MESEMASGFIEFARRNPDYRLVKLQFQLQSDIYYFKSKLNGISGYGLDSDQNTAILKSVSELAERRSFIKCYSHFQTTNGIAVHSDVNEAKKAAKFELIERDVILTFFHFGLCWGEIETNGDFEDFSIIQYFREKHLTLRLACPLCTDEYFVVVGVLFVPGGWCDMRVFNEIY